MSSLPNLSRTLSLTCFLHDVLLDCLRWMAKALIISRRDPYRTSRFVLWIRKDVESVVVDWTACEFFFTGSFTEPDSLKESQ